MNSERVRKVFNTLMRYFAAALLVFSVVSRLTRTGDDPKPLVRAYQHIELQVVEFTLWACEQLTFLDPALGLLIASAPVTVGMPSVVYALSWIIVAFYDDQL